MTTTDRLSGTSPRTTSWRAGGRAATAAVLLAALALAVEGCGSIAQSIANKVTHGLVGGNAVLNNFTGKIKTGSLTSYDVTYVTTGSNASTIEYAAEPPHDWGFSTSSPSGGDVKFVQSSSGEFDCSQSSGSSGSSPGSWSCLSIPGDAAADYQELYQFYTGSYWVSALAAYSTVAGLVAGVKVRSTHMSVNGFSLSCVVISGTSGNTGSNASPSTFCETSQGILGYVSDGGTSNFEIKSFSTSPSASFFQVPSGATITTLPTTTT